MNKEQRAAARRMLSREHMKRPEPEPKQAKIEIEKLPGHSCYSCIHYIEEMPDNPDYDTTQYCDVTNSHNLNTWPFTHTVCAKWEHERAPQVEEE